MTSFPQPVLTKNLPLPEFIGTIDIYRGERGKYYIHEGVRYDIHFPLAWALDHRGLPPRNLRYKNDPPTFFSGPTGCKNCASYGSLNGVFVGYCVACIDRVYNGDRSGVIEMHDITYEELWEQLPYMKGVYQGEIGNKPIPRNEYDTYNIVACHGPDIAKYHMCRPDIAIKENMAKVRASIRKIMEKTDKLKQIKIEPKKQQILPDMEVDCNEEDDQEEQDTALYEKKRKPL
jgi:hypothetical protein